MKVSYLLYGKDFLIWSYPCTIPKRLPYKETFFGMVWTIAQVFDFTTNTIIHQGISNFTSFSSDSVLSFLSCPTYFDTSSKHRLHRLVSNSSGRAQESQPDLNIAMAHRGECHARRRNHVCDRLVMIRLNLSYFPPSVIFIARFSLGCIDIVNMIQIFMTSAVDNIYVAHDFIRYLSLEIILLFVDFIGYLSL